MWTLGHQNGRHRGRQEEKKTNGSVLEKNFLPFLFSRENRSLFTIVHFLREDNEPSGDTTSLEKT